MAAWLAVTLVTGQATAHRTCHYLEYRALEKLDARLKDDKSDTEAYLERGKVHASLGEWTAARRDFKRAMDLNPRNPEPYIQQGDSFLRPLTSALRGNKRLLEALKFYDQAIELDSTNALAYARRCEVFYEMGLTERALTESNIAINLDPSVHLQCPIVVLAPPKTSGIEP